MTHPTLVEESMVPVHPEIREQRMLSGVDLAKESADAVAANTEPTQPPISNEFVKEGCEKFSEPKTDKAHLTLEIIAAICHDANKAYCEFLGDASQLRWAEAAEWQRQSALKGVKFHLQNPEATPEASHESWLEEKEKQGWEYGEVKDVENKKHPCFRPYAELPIEQQVKDYLFRGIVHALRNVAEPIL